MSVNKERQLKQNIRRLTKSIGEARTAHQRDEVSNFRAQRESFARQLAEEYEQYYVIRDGRTKFVSQQEAYEHYQEPENRKRIRGAGAVQQLFGQRQWFYKTLQEYAAMTDAELREKVELTLCTEMEQREKFIHEIQKEIGEEPIDFTVVDTRADESAELLQGIDFSSLDNHGNNEQETDIS